MANKVSELFDESIWQEVSGFEGLTDVTYHQHVSLGVVRIAFNRPEVRNAFRPQTVDELANTLTHAQANTKVGGFSSLGFNQPLRLWS
jgi:naphthoate synthase